MAGNVVVEDAAVAVVPGETATCRIRVRNSGTVVDSFSLTVLGDPAAWTTVVPAALSLFPGSDGTFELHFAPPRASNVGSGATPFGVRVVGSEDPDNPVVEEGEVNLLPFVEVAAKLTPRTSESKRKARHEIIVDNKGNAAIPVVLSVSDPDEQLAFQLVETNITVEAGQARHVPLKVAARKGFARGADKHRPFQVKVTPAGAAFPTQLDGNLIQKPGLPRFVVPLVAAVVAVALVAAVLPGVLNKDAKGNLQLASDDAATTTTAAPAEEDEGEDPNAPATAEEAEAAAAAERAANGRDPDAPTSGSGGGGGGDDGTSASSSGGGTAAGGGTTATTSVADTPAPGETPTTASGGTRSVTTTTTAPAGSTTTTAAPASTTTTVPSVDSSVRGTWTFDFDTGVEGASGSDIHWNQQTSTTRYFQPYNGGMVFNMGAVNYDAVTKAQLQGLAYSTAGIDGSDSTNKMPPGTVIAIKTNAGRFAKMKVISKEPYPSNKLYFRYYTYP
jgi:hypothetical protein